MNEITIVEKPNNISFDVIKSILHEAHKFNYEKGIVMHTTTFDANELEDYIGLDGKCFVALCEDKVVGTASYRLINRKSWYTNGKIADEVLVGVCPEYTGKHIYRQLYKAIEDDVRKKGYDLIVFNTAEGNKRKQEVSLNMGFKYVSFFVANDNDHYSVVMAKWLNECPFSNWRIGINYKRIKLFTKLRYKPGKIKRFI